MAGLAIAYKRPCKRRKQKIQCIVSNMSGFDEESPVPPTRAASVKNGYPSSTKKTGIAGFFNKKGSLIDYIHVALTMIILLP